MCPCDGVCVCVEVRFECWMVCVCVCVCVRIIFRLEFHTNANILQTILNFHNGKNFEIIWI